MRRTRRGHSGMEFGGSGEDSFVAVVVTKLTGALLFILLLTMVIMALLPKAIDLPSSPGAKEAAKDAPPLMITTPEDLPEAIAGRPYGVALAADNGVGPLKWSLAGKLPDGLTFVPTGGRIEGTPLSGTSSPVSLSLRVSDGNATAMRPARLVVYKPDGPLSMPSKWAPALPPIPWRAWFERGFGFLVLWLVHLVGLNTLDSLRRWSLDGADDDEVGSIRVRFVVYKVALSLLTLAATAGLAAWLWWPR